MVPVRQRNCRIAFARVKITHVGLLRLRLAVDAIGDCAVCFEWRSRLRLRGRLGDVLLEPLQILGLVVYTFLETRGIHLGQEFPRILRVSLLGVIVDVGNTKAGNIAVRPVGSVSENTAYDNFIPAVRTIQSCRANLASLYAISMRAKIIMQAQS